MLRQVDPQRNKVSMNKTEKSEAVENKELMLSEKGMTQSIL